MDCQEIVAQPKSYIYETPPAENLIKALPEIFFHIFSFVHIRDFKAIAKVNTTWHVVGLEAASMSDQ